MLERIQDRVVKILWKIELAPGHGGEDHEESSRVQRALPPPPPKQQLDVLRRAERSAGAGQTPAVEVGRNDPCPCGSGKKYKKCHGVNAA